MTEQTRSKHGNALQDVLCKVGNPSDFRHHYLSPPPAPVRVLLLFVYRVL